MSASKNRSTCLCIRSRLFGRDHRTPRRAVEDFHRILLPAGPKQRMIPPPAGTVNGTPAPWVAPLLRVVRRACPAAMVFFGDSRTAERKYLQIQMDRVIPICWPNSMSATVMRSSYILGAKGVQMRVISASISASTRRSIRLTCSGLNIIAFGHRRSFALALRLPARDLGARPIP